MVENEDGGSDPWTVLSAHRDLLGTELHVAGIVASSGENLPTVTNVINSATNANFQRYGSQKGESILITDPFLPAFELG